MQFDWTLKTPPVFEPVTLQDGKDHLRVSSEDENGLIHTYLMAARQWVEAYTERALCTQTWQMSLEGFPRELWLPRSSPLQSITFVKYYDADNVLQTWNAANYYTASFHEPAQIMPTQAATFPGHYCRPDAVQVEYVSGYAADACPEALRLAVLELAAHYYENREAVVVGTTAVEAPHSVTALAAPWRVFWWPPCR